MLGTGLDIDANKEGADSSDVTFRSVVLFKMSGELELMLEDKEVVDRDSLLLVPVLHSGLLALKPRKYIIKNTTFCTNTILYIYQHKVFKIDKMTINKEFYKYYNHKLSLKKRQNKTRFLRKQMFYFSFVQNN